MNKKELKRPKLVDFWESVNSKEFPKLGGVNYFKYAMALEDYIIAKGF